MAAGAYQKYEKTQGNGTWADEWATPLNARKDTLQLHFSKMGRSSTSAPNTIVADRMEVEI
jgi:hypothetical protein